MTIVEKEARSKPSLLELANALQDVRKAGNGMGYSRLRFCESRRHFHTDQFAAVCITAGSDCDRL
jgi:hypothetical protein